MYWNEDGDGSPSSLPGLIETWDVLKYWITKAFNAMLAGINRNMRCIEMWKCIVKGIACLD